MPAERIELPQPRATRLQRAGLTTLPNTGMKSGTVAADVTRDRHSLVATSPRRHCSEASANPGSCGRDPPSESTRIGLVGREGFEPPCPEGSWSTASRAAVAQPTHRRLRAPPLDPPEPTAGAPWKGRAGLASCARPWACGSTQGKQQRTTWLTRPGCSVSPRSMDTGLHARRRRRTCGPRASPREPPSPGQAWPRRGSVLLRSFFSW